MDQIDQIIVSSDSLDAAVEAVEGVCDLLGELLAPTCHTFLQHHLPQIIVYLVEHELAPQAVCEALTLCEAAPKIAMVHPTFSQKFARQ